VFYGVLLQNTGCYTRVVTTPLLDCFGLHARITTVTDIADNVWLVAVLALRHRLRKDPLESSGDEVRIERAIADIRAKHKVG